MRIHVYFQHMSLFINVWVDQCNCECIFFFPFFLFDFSDEILVNHVKTADIDKQRVRDRWPTVKSIGLDIYLTASLNHPGLFESLKAEKFDAAFSEPMDKCGYGTEGENFEKNFDIQESSIALASRT